MAGKQKLTDKITKWLWYLVASSILISAVIISLVRFALTEIDSYQETIELLATKATNHKVYIESLDARLVGLMPTLVLEGVHVFAEDGKTEILRVNSANIGVSLIQSIKHQTFVPKEIHISGTRLALIRTSDGQIKFQGFDFKQDGKVEAKGDEGLTKWFFSQSSLALKDSAIIWKDYKRKQKPVTFSDINIELLNQGNNHQLIGSFSPSSQLGKRIEVAMDITGDLQNPAEWKGDFFVQGDEIFLAKWGERIRHKKVELTDGIADFQLWGSLKENGLNKIYGDISAYQLKIKHNKTGKQIDVGLVGGLFELGYKENNWFLNVDRFQYTGTGGILPETNFSIISSRTNQEQTAWDIRVGSIDLQGISELVINSGLLEDKHEALLKSLAPTGYISKLRLSSRFEQQQQKFLAHAYLDNISFQHHQKLPGVKNLSGEIWLDDKSGSLALQTKNAALDFGNVFRNPIKLKDLTGNVQWWRFNNGWQVSTTELQAENNEITTLSNLSLFLPTSGPAYIDLQSSFAGNAQAKSNYLPVAIMNKALVDWLDRSLVSGVISNGGLVYRGRLSEFPYRKPDGQFLVQLYTDNLELDYQKGWPAIKNADFDATFTSKGISIDLHLARLFSSAVTNTRIALNDYRDAVVDIKGNVTGGLTDVVKFVVNSPLKVSDELLDIRYAGRAKTSIEIHIPLKKGAKTGYSGDVSISKGEMQLLSEEVALKSINGNLTFSNEGFGSKNLTAKIFEQVLAVNVYSQVTATGNKTYLATSGQTEMPLLLKSFSIPAYQHSKGKMAWQALLDFSDDKEKVPVLTVQSDLKGVSFDMPYPFNKQAAAKKEMLVKTYFKGGGLSELHVNYGDSLSLAGSLAKEQSGTVLERGHIRFASGDATLPDNNVLYVTGNLARFYPAQWANHMSAYKRPGNGSLLDIPVLLNMNRLSIEVGKTNTDKGLSIRPTDFPVISGNVNKLRFDGMPLGKLSIDMIHRKGALKLNKLNINSADMNFNSSGRWSYTDNRHNSIMNVRLKSKDLGKLFKRLGFAAIINNGKSDIKGAINWSGTPFEFSLEKLNGNLRVFIKDGSIADVDPGAGRVVGLLSLSELPRRLMLDFSDMFKKGLVFDEIKGKLTLKQGNAYTEAINVKSAVANVKIEGRTGLVDRDYDQLVHVIPKVGDTLPVASGVLFGTQIGALVLLFEKMMGKEIEKAAERKYKVTGSWEDPNIERLDKPVEPVEQDEDDFDDSEL